MSALIQAAREEGPISAEKAAQLNEMFAQLRAQGTAAIPAIAEFLKRNEDLKLASIPGASQVSYGSVRLGLIDTLAQIGGSNAADLAVEVIQGSGDPAEVAALTRTLESIAPDQYHDVELAAVRDLLVQMSGAQIKGGEAAPLFETAQAIGGVELIPALQGAVAGSSYYATLALAGLKDGAGIPALIELANDPSVSGMGPGDYALRPLAQVALQSPEAAAALMEQARQNKIPDSAWPAVATALAGNYMQYGNQLFGPTTPAIDWSTESVSRRIDFLSQLAAATVSASGQSAIRDAQAILAQKLTN